MKIIYHSAFESKELAPGSIIYTAPCKAQLLFQPDKNDVNYDVLVNGEIVDIKSEVIDCDEETEVVVRCNNDRTTYSIKPIAGLVSSDYARAYEQFAYEYKLKSQNEIDSIKNGAIKLYAVDQSTEVHDWTDTFKKIEDGYNHFKAICEKPKSHLKSTNEVRPIDTVKRTGYESIPYLASHSEDWLARTASGLKPARLFSRVEDDEYQIYENRVTKTLIDLIISFLRKKEKELRDQRDQLIGILNCSVQVGTFGFDTGFQIAVSELMSSDTKGDEYRSKLYKLVNELHDTAEILLKKYRTLRQSRLYRYIKRAKPVANPLNETNILLMDKHYNVVYKLWKSILKDIAPKVLEKDSTDVRIAYRDYQKYCQTLCGYAAHTMNFDTIEDGVYFRSGDNLEYSFFEWNGMVRCSIKDKTRRSMTVPGNITVPLAIGETTAGFYYDGTTLFWDNDLGSNEIEQFCSRLKTKESRGKEQAEEKRKYGDLKRILDQKQRESHPIALRDIIIWPIPVEIDENNRVAFKEYVNQTVKSIIDTGEVSCIVIALPKCDENEQKLIEYAKQDDEQCLILPLTMFDINSYRRIQNVLLRHILMLTAGNGRCPNCGNEIRGYDNQFVCNNCNQLILTKTICPYQDCRREYYYLSYNIPEDTILKMQNVDSKSFYQVDSLYQYKDIIEMSVESNKLRTVCPHCHRS